MPVFALLDFEQKKAAAAFFSGPNSQKLRSLAKAEWFLIIHSCNANFGQPRKPARNALCRQPLATASTTCCDNLAAACSSHTGAKPVTTCADKFGWLISTLHLFNTAVCGPSCGLFFDRSISGPPLAHNNTPPGRSTRTCAAYRGMIPRSQLIPDNSRIGKNREVIYCTGATFVLHRALMEQIWR